MDLCEMKGKFATQSDLGKFLQDNILLKTIGKNFFLMMAFTY